jgi:hypothetical protein
MKPYILLLMVSVLVGCRATGHVGEGDPAKLSVGMTREQVIQKLGKPESVVSEGDTEVIGYTVEGPWGRRETLKVKLVGEKVKSYEVLHN